MTAQTTKRPTLTFPAYRTWRGGLRVLPGRSVEEMREEVDQVLKEAFERECVVEVMRWA